MTPVHQRIICQNRGDCQTACIASLLSLPYEQVPPWLADAYDRTRDGKPRPDGKPYHLHHWLDDMNLWLADRGMHLLRVPYTLIVDTRSLLGALCIASVPSQALPGHSHAVIGTWVPHAHVLDGSDPARWPVFTVRFDPNPNNKPYPLDIEPTAVSFLVPMDPTRIITNPVKGCET